MKTISLFFVLFTSCFVIPVSAQEFDRRPALPFESPTEIQTQCGFTNDLQDVETYDGTLGIDEKYVDDHEPSTVQFRWLIERNNAGHPLLR